MSTVTQNIRAFLARPEMNPLRTRLENGAIEAFARHDYESVVSLLRARAALGGDLPPHIALLLAACLAKTGHHALAGQLLRQVTGATPNEELKASAQKFVNLCRQYLPEIQNKTLE